MELSSVIYLVLGIVQTIQAPICRPTITESIGEQKIGGFISLECEFSTCSNLTKMVFEKVGLNTTWTQMFEGVNKTYYKALDTDAQYTLQNRYDYYAFRTSVNSLHISPLILQDHGEWRCSVFDVTGKKYHSVPLVVNVYVPPAEGHFYISPNNSHLVIDQEQEFTCLADGINPEPEVLWDVNGVKYKGNTTTNQRDDQLWVVINAIRLKLKQIGINKLNCIMRMKEKDPWLERHINIFVQKAATVLYPQHDKTETVDVHSTFSLKCIGSGYNPSISWNRNGETITFNDTKYNMNQDCDTSKCEGSITSQPMDATVPCEYKEQYSVVYTCVITVAPPYYSSAVSANMNVTFLKQLCEENGNNNPAVVVTIVCVVSLFLVLKASCIALLVRNRRKKRSNEELPGGPNMQEEPLLRLDEMPDGFTPPYKTRKWLQLCYQRGEYDTIVFFDYGLKSVYIHNISDLTKFHIYNCVVNIYDMIQLPQHVYVVTQHKTHDIHLVKLQEGQFHIIDTMANNTDIRRTLICAENDNSFIKCEFNGEDLQYQVTIYRVSVTDNKLIQQSLTKDPFTQNGEPWRISLIGTSNELVIIHLSGKIYRGNLENFNADTNDDTLSEHIAGGLRSLYIDRNDTLIMGTKSGEIHVYTTDKQHRVMHVGKNVHGITIVDERLIICCGKGENQQYIKVFSYDQLHN